MVYIKFAFVKLIIKSILPACLIILSSVEGGLAKQKYAIQIAASKTRQNIQYLAEKYNITDSIFVIESDSWNRYLIGSFDDIVSASEYANELSQKTKLKNVFVQEIDIAEEQINKIQETDSSIHLYNSSNTSIETDSVQDLSNPFVNNNSADSNIKVEFGLNNKSKSNNLLYSLFNKSKVTSAKNSLINYGNDHLPQEIRGFYISIIEKSFQFPIIFVFCVFILLFILNIISVFLILNYTIRKKNHRERYVNLYTKIYEETLLSYIFGELNWARTIVKLKRKDRKVNREILISILLNFQENLRGVVDKFIPEIYIKLNLQKDSFKAANSNFNYRKVQGIRELTYLYSDGALGTISNLINDSNDIVRAEAQTAFIRLNPDEPFQFFQKLTRPFTRWTQLSAFNLMRIHQLPVPAFADFLDSKHTNIQNFCLRMIIYFQQLENVAEVMKMLESKNDQTRFLAYMAINDLRLQEGKDILINKFANETDKNKLEIIKAFRNIGNLEDFDFLVSVIKTEAVSLKVEACRSMYFMNNEVREKLMQIKHEEIPEIELYIAHVTDSRN